MFMNLEYGNLLWMDTYDSGTLLYMVLKSPIECEHCGFTLLDWDKNENDEVICPECSRTILEFRKKKCSCGEEDLVSLIVASNNNFHVSYDGVTPYEHLINLVKPYCIKSILKEISQGKIRKLSHEEEIYRKRLLIWTGSDDYEPGKPIPQWIKEAIK